jgi:hypothetical protein
MKEEGRASFFGNSQAEYKSPPSGLNASFRSVAAEVSTLITETADDFLNQLADCFQLVGVI